MVISKLPVPTLPVPVLPVPALVGVELTTSLAIVDVMSFVNMMNTVALTFNENARMSTMLLTSVTRMTVSPDNQTLCESCENRCGDWDTFYQCHCSTDCRKSSSCCGDFQMVCPHEHRQFIPELCDPDDDVSDNRTLCESCQGQMW